MSNAWIDDGFYGQAWVRLCGPVAAHVYIAATCIVHRDMPDDLAVTEAEIRDELPWDVSDGDFQRALGALVARGRFVQNGDRFIIAKYPIEQESQEAQAGRRAKAIKANAAWLEKYKGRHKRAPSDEETPQATHERSLVASVHPSVHPSIHPSVIPSSTGLPASPSDGDSKAEKPRRVRTRTKAPKADPPPERPAELPADKLARWEREYRELVAAGGTLPAKDLVWQRYYRLFYNSTGSGPTEHSKHFANIATLLKSHTTDVILARLERYFSSHTLFACREGSQDFDRFIFNFDKLAPKIDPRMTAPPPEPLPPASDAPLPPETQALLDDFLGRKRVTA